MLAILAAALGMVGIVLTSKGLAQGYPCCDGYGGYSARVLSNLITCATSACLFMVPFCALCAWVIFQSFFTTGPFTINLLQCLTTEAGLRSLQLVTHLCFFVSFFLNQLLLLWLFGTTILGHICKNSMMTSPAQMVVVGMSQSPGKIFEAFFSGGAKEMPFLLLNVREALQGFSVSSYCETMANSDQSLFDLWLGSLFLTIGLSIMAVALRGEKQRVHVHEMNEMAGLAGSAGEAVEGLLSSPGAAAGVATALGGPVLGGLVGAGMAARDSMSPQSSRTMKGLFG